MMRLLYLMLALAAAYCVDADVASADGDFRVELEEARLELRTLQSTLEQVLAEVRDEKRAKRQARIDSAI